MSDSIHPLSRRQVSQTRGWLEPRFISTLPADTYLSGGSNVVENPNLVVQDPQGTKRPSNDDGHNANAAATPETEKSDAGNSVISIHDMGLSSRPALRLHYSGKCDLFDNIMELAELRMSLDLEADSTASIEQSIRQKIEKKLEKSKLDDKEYLPIDDFNSIFCLGTLKSLVKEKHPAISELDFNDRISKIVGVRSDQSRLRVLGIFLMMESYNYIDQFIEAGVWDSDLPLFTPDKNTEEIHTANGTHLVLMDGWDSNDLILFLEYQWIFMVPFFDFHERALCYHEFKEQVRLPWRTLKYSDSGGNSSVYKLEIHPGHHNYPGSQQPTYFALKMITSNDQQAYRQELSALEKACAHVQKVTHLIKLLLTFKYKNSYYLLFEWADGNLRDFWEHNTAQNNPAFTSEWMAEQCLGLSRAVQSIHGLTTWQVKKRGDSEGDQQDWGRHGDIKPNNILWFAENNRNRNVLVISDLGLTRYHSRLSKSMIDSKRLDGYTWPYRPPEVDMLGLISPKFDIWSLGCVFLESMVWYLRGKDALFSFEEERFKEDQPSFRGVQEDKFFNVSESNGRKKASIKLTVRECISELYNLPNCTSFTKAMLQLIEDKMLVIDVNQRASIKDIYRDLLPFKRGPQAVSHRQLAPGTKAGARPRPSDTCNESHLSDVDSWVRNVGQCISTSKAIDNDLLAYSTSQGGADETPDKHISNGDISFETDPESLLNRQSNNIAQEARLTSEVMSESHIGPLLLPGVPEQTVPSGSVSQSINQSHIFKYDFDQAEQLRTYSLGSRRKSQINLMAMKKGRRHRIKHWLRKAWGLAVRISRNTESG